MEDTIEEEFEATVESQEENLADSAGTPGGDGGGGDEAVSLVFDVIPGFLRSSLQITGAFIGMLLGDIATMLANAYLIMKNMVAFPAFALPGVAISFEPPPLDRAREVAEAVAEVFTQFGWHTVGWLFQDIYNWFTWVLG